MEVMSLSSEGIIAGLICSVTCMQARTLVDDHRHCTAIRSNSIMSVGKKRFEEPSPSALSTSALLLRLPRRSVCSGFVP